MKISYNWLSQYLSDIPGPEETADKLTLTGLEVEEIERTGSNFSRVFVGEVLDVKPHPDADRLVVCQVDIGEETPSQIVCGAPNVEQGQKVAVAAPGAVLPITLPDGSPFEIKKAKIRGQQSAGMICAEDELGLGTDHSGIMVLDPSAKTGTPFSDVVGASEDFVMEIGLTPNRPDAACHLGVARDLAAVTGAELKKPLSNLPDITASLPDDAVKIMDTDKCHRYAGILIRDIKVKESPKWLQQHLLSIGLRPLNNIVDITNFVLHELGQPLHAFDYARLDNGKIVVQSFEKDMAFSTLDDVERSVPAGSLFICDGNKPVALAGVMGGLNSEITESTSDILIESAWFEPSGIRKTARKLALQTDSSYRFERGVDPDITLKAALRCAELVLELCGGHVEGMADVHPVKPETKTIHLRYDRLSRILGVQLDKKVITGILNSLEFDVSEEPGDETVWNCTVPSFRPDIHGEIDLIEEVARIYDYNNIPDPERVSITSPEPVPYREAFIEKVRNAAVASGLTEIYSNSLLPENLLEDLGGEETVVQTLNPITKDQALLRPDLLYGFLRSAAYNFNRNVTGVAFFEIGNIFKKDHDGGSWIRGIHESTHLIVGVAGQTHEDHWKAKPRNFDIFDLKALVTLIIEKLGLGETLTWIPSENGLRLFEQHAHIKGKTAHKNASPVGWISEVNDIWRKKTDVESDTYIAEFDLTALQVLAEKRQKRTYNPLSRFPAFEFDLALVVDSNVLAGDLHNSIWQIANNTLKDIKLFDVFEGKSLGENRKSIAFRLTFQDNEKTLTINDVEPVISKLLKKLGNQYGAELRS